MNLLNDQKTIDAIKTTLEEMIEGIQILSHEWRYIYVNKAAAQHGRKVREELIGRRIHECYPGIEKSPVFNDLNQVMQTGTGRRLENEFEFENGKKCWFELFVEPHPFGILIRSIDITDRKLIEEQLRHSQKMEAIGQLAGGIAHDYNNKLGIILAYCEMILELPHGAGSSIPSYIEKVLIAIRQSTTLTRQLLAFSRKQVLDPKVISLNTLLLDMKSGLQKLLPENISVKYFLDESLGNVKVDATQIDQVILNLVINARDAMPQGGTLLIESANSLLDGTYAEKHPEVLPGRYAMISFSDTGIGMAKQTKDRIFEPFFTTKGKMGTGLGLATVHGIVKQSRGHIWVYSEPEMGTVFKLYFPIVDEALDEHIATEPNHPSQYHGSEGILLVEDDELLRTAYMTALKHAGYHVFPTADANEAETCFTTNSPNIALLLTDLVLPKSGGRALAEQLKKFKPDLKVVYMSGYTENSIVHQGVLDTESVLLQKPISIHKMLETLRQVLEGKVRKALI